MQTWLIFQKHQRYHGIQGVCNNKNVTLNSQLKYKLDEGLVGVSALSQEVPEMFSISRKVSSVVTKWRGLYKVKG